MGALPNAQPDAPWNTLLVGDNLDALTRADVLGPDLLGGPVDLVVTDPPYNTGNGFAYDDDRRGEGGGPAGDRSGRHAAWTAYLRPRLVAVREVMAPTGALFASIDDHEAAHLRLLLDEVFGEENFVAQIVVNLNTRGRQLGPWFATDHEYLLVYARDARRCVLDATSAETVDPRDFPLVAPDGRRYRHLPLRNTNTRFTPASTPTMHFPVWGDPDSGRVSTEPFEGAVEVRPVFGDGRPAVWRWSRTRMEERLDDLVCRRVRGRLGERVDVSQRDWLHPGRRKKLRTIWHAAEVGSVDHAVAELKELVGPVFESPKPTGLVRRVLATMPADAHVLDPFAGSGTTGHAVALANLADGGARRCTSIELPVAPAPASRAAALGYGRVADVTRARLAAVAERVGGDLVVRELGPA